MTGGVQILTGCLAVVAAALVMPGLALANDCVFVAADEAGSAIRFGRTESGVLIFETWNDVSEDQSLCAYQPGY